MQVTILLILLLTYLYTIVLMTSFLCECASTVFLSAFNVEKFCRLFTPSTRDGIQNLNRV